MTDTWTDRTPPGRYGPPPSRHRAVLARAGMVALALAAVATALWIGLSAGTVPVTWEDVGFSVRGSDQVDVTFRVTKEPSATAACTLTALSSSYAQVGVVTVTVGPAQGSTVEQTVPVATQEPAVTGFVDACEVLEP